MKKINQKDVKRLTEEIISGLGLPKQIRLVENVTYHKTHVKRLGTVVLPDPQHGDLKLSVMPFENTGKWVSLPEGFKMWEKAFNNVIKRIPLQEGANTHYVTIDTKFFTKDEFLRREGVHIDGNFCVDPNFRSLNENEFKSSWGGAMPSWGGARYKEPETDFDQTSEYFQDVNSTGLNSDSDFMGDTKASWGGATPLPTWGGIRGKRFQVLENNAHVEMDWVLPYDITIPISEYVSDKKGGIITVSTEVGCQAWNGTFIGEVMGEGSYEKMKDQLTEDKKIIFEENGLYFMSSNTPHETLLIEKGKRRTFMRITLNHNYMNEAILKNEK